MRAIMAVLLPITAACAIPMSSEARTVGVDTIVAAVDAPMFAGAPLADDALSTISGGQSPLPARLTIRTAYRMVDDAARADLRQTASVGRISMDVWWGSVGSEMIAINVRAAGRP